VLTGQDARLHKARTDLGDMFVYSLWLASYLMGTITGRGGVPMRVLVEGAPGAVARAGLDTLAAGGSIGTLLPARLVHTYQSEAAALAEHGFTSGLTG
jgi:hypothetical protein